MTNKNIKTSICYITRSTFLCLLYIIVNLFNSKTHK
nr:MAG TPA: hypothetical protein [Caudoviricetes sp.]